MATAAARQQRNGDAVAYAATLERWRQEVFAGAVRRRIHADQGVHLHAARRAAADAIRTAALCERRWRAAQAHAAAADAARRESEELLGRERRGVVHACRNAFDAMRCVEIKILRRVRVVLHAIDATPARWRGDAGSSPLDRARSAASSPRNDLVKNCRVHPTHWLICTQVLAREDGLCKSRRKVRCIDRTLRRRRRGGLRDLSARQDRRAAEYSVGAALGEPHGGLPVSAGRADEPAAVLLPLRRADLHFQYRRVGSGRVRARLCAVPKLRGVVYSVAGRGAQARRVRLAARAAAVRGGRRGAGAGADVLPVTNRVSLGV